MDNQALRAGRVAGLLCPPAETSSADSLATATSGLKACKATHVIRQGGTVIHDTLFGLRNLDEVATVTIKRIQAFGQDGSFLFDSDAFGFPAQPEFTAILAPRTASAFYAADITGPLAGAYDVIKVYIHYSLDIPGRPLWASLKRRIRDGDGYAVTGETSHCGDIRIEN